MTFPNIFSPLSWISLFPLFTFSVLWKMGFWGFIIFTILSITFGIFSFIKKENKLGKILSLFSIIVSILLLFFTILSNIFSNPGNYTPGAFSQIYLYLDKL